MVGEDFALLGREALKEQLHSIVDRIILDHKTFNNRIDYLVAMRDQVASPRGVEPLSPP